MNNTRMILRLRNYHHAYDVRLCTHFLPFCSVQDDPTNPRAFFAYFYRTSSQARSKHVGCVFLIIILACLLCLCVYVCVCVCVCSLLVTLRRFLFLSVLRHLSGFLTCRICDLSCFFMRFFLRIARFCLLSISSPFSLLRMRLISCDEM